MKIICFAYLMVILKSAVAAHQTTSSPVLKPTFHVSRRTVAEGERVEFVCKVHASPSESVTIWNKRTFYGANHTSAGNADEPPVEVSTSLYLNEPFSKLERYSSGYTLPRAGDSSYVHFTLNISNASTEDSGYYSCKVSIGIASQESERVLLQVVSPVREVWWEATYKSGDPQTFQKLIPTQGLLVEDGDKLSVRCVSEGGFPAPIYTVTRKDGTGSSMNPFTTYAVDDLTAMFKQNSVRKEGQGPKNLRPLFFSTTLEPRDEGRLTLNYDFNRKAMVCSAKVENHPDPSKRLKTAEFTIDLTRFAPKIFCPNKMKAKPNENNFEISCVVHASPAPTEFRFTFMNATNVTDLTGQSKTKAEVINGTWDEQVRATLTIFRVSWSHFGKYELFTWNEKGNASHVVELVKDNSKETKSPQFSAADGSSSSSSSSESSRISHSSLSTIVFVADLFGGFFFLLIQLVGRY